MPDALVVFSLGPVQSFIAEARRTQDIWAGSRLLSELVGRALDVFEKHGGKVIYPVTTGGAGPAFGNLPNKVFVRIDVDRAVEAATAAERAARATLKELGQRVAMDFRGPKDDTWWEIWNRQIDNHLEVYWAAVRIDGNYVDAAAHASRVFEATKRTRHFTQAVEQGPKDSLSGTRSALHTKGLTASEYWREAARLIGVPQLRPNGSERLDALGVIKRFGFAGQRFPSTSTVACRPFLRAAKARAAQELRAYRDAVAKVPKFYVVSPDDQWPYDGDLLYVETLSEQRLASDYGFGAPDLERWKGELAEAVARLKALYKAMGASPSTYYAVLLMDGDNMGKHVSLCRTEKEHSALSERLNKFAGCVRTIVERSDGALVYCGGDDVLALLPLANAIETACALREEYGKTFEKWTERFEHHSEPFTCSAGLAIAHHTSPLGSALRAARDAESHAKRFEGKDALAVAVLKRSGEALEAVGHWSDIARHFPTMKRWFGGDEQKPETSFSNRLAPAAVRAAEELGSADLFIPELKRLARRHLERGGPDPATALQELDQLQKWAEDLEVALRRRQRESGTRGGATDRCDRPTGVVVLAWWIAIAAFTARGVV